MLRRIFADGRGAGMITTLEQLDASLGRMPAAVGLKVIDHIDSEAQRWISASPLAFLSLARLDGVAVTAAGGSAGFAQVQDRKRLSVPCECLDRPELLSHGCGIGMLFLVPGIGETLRVNGRVLAVTDAHVELAIEEVYVHCAKALLRSGFWSAARRDDIALDADAFIATARFVALATVDAEGHADLSPKGDAAGNMLRRKGDALSYAERPGNKRKDSLRNLIVQPQAAALAIIPGSSLIASIGGLAELDQEPAACAAFAVDGKAPRLVTRLTGAHITLSESAALHRANLWPLRATGHGIDPARVLTAHIKLNKTVGFAAGLLRKVVSKRVMDASLRHDYKNRMY